MTEKNDQLVDYFGISIERIEACKTSAELLVLNGGKCDGIQCEDCCCYKDDPDGIAAPCIAIPDWADGHPVNNTIALTLGQLFLEEYEKATTIG
jgi:hypothetical protein